MKSDIPMKRLLQIKTDDWISFLFPKLTNIHLTDMQADVVARIKQESVMDNVKMLNNECVVHFEPMGYKDDALPARMLRYRADIWEYTLGHGLGLPSIKQIVIFFFDKHDNGVHHLDDKWETEQTLDYSYKVVKAWEIDSDDIVKRKLIGLYPLLPLTKHKAEMDAEKIIKSAIETIHSVEDPACRVDLLAAMSLLAAVKFSKELIKKFVRREQLMQSALFDEWVAEFVEEAEEKKTLEIAQEFLRIGVSIDKVVEASKLPLGKVIELKRSLEKSDAE